MDHASRNGTAALIDVDYPIDRSIPVSRTPLGEPMNRATAWFSNYDPLTWALQYWLDIHTLGVLIGEDLMLMSYRIDIELNKYDQAFLARFSQVWDQFRKDNGPVRMRYWTQMTQHGAEAQPYLRDIATMLTDKKRKAREYLPYVQAVMIDELRKPNLEHARSLFDNIGEIYRLLQQEEGIETEEANPAEASQTPLGAPLSPAVAWHLQYWLDLGLIGTLRGEDNLLMGVRIEIEHTKTLSPTLHHQFQSAWIKYQITHRAERLRYWSQITPLDDSNDEARPYIRHLKTMLVDKGRKTRDYLRAAEAAMILELEDLKNFDRAQLLFNRLARLYPRLRREEAEFSGELIELD